MAASAFAYETWLARPASASSMKLHAPLDESGVAKPFDFPFIRRAPNCRTNGSLVRACVPFCASVVDGSHKHNSPSSLLLSMGFAQRAAAPTPMVTVAAASTHRQSQPALSLSLSPSGVQSCWFLPCSVSIFFLSLSFSPSSLSLSLFLFIAIIIIILLLLYYYYYY